MKSLIKILSVLLLISMANAVFAGVDTNNPPVGLKEMAEHLKATIKKNNRNFDSVIGLEYKLSMPVEVAQKNYNLSLIPENAFKIIKEGNTFKVTVIASAINFSVAGELPGSFNLTISHEWRFGGTTETETETGTWQACQIKVGFRYDGDEVTPATLDSWTKEGFSYQIKFDAQTLKQIASEEAFIFERKNNTAAKVELQITRPDQKVVTLTSEELPFCEQKEQPKYVWSKWSEWNSCSASCNGGKQSRTRVCQTSNIPCVGNSFEEKECNTHACSNIAMTEAQKKQMRTQVTLNIISYTKLTVFKKKGTANYEAALSNPFNRTIRCDINLTSSRGYNTDYQTIDHKSHIGVVVEPLGVSKMVGTINIMKGHDDTGMSWADALYRGNTYFAENCMFLN